MHFNGTETAAAIEQALQELLFPITTPATGEARSCGSEGATRCSRSVFVYEYFNAAVNHGRDLLIGFRGERNAGVGAIPQIIVTGDSNDAAVAIELVRQDGHQLLRPRDAQHRARPRQRRAQRARHDPDHQPRRSATATTASTSRTSPTSASTAGRTTCRVTST